MARRTSHKRVHRVVTTVVFDRPCSAREAVRAVADCVHGDFYPTPERDGGPEQFRIKSVTLPAKPMSIA